MIPKISHGKVKTVWDFATNFGGIASLRVACLRTCHNVRTYLNFGKEKILIGLAFLVLFY